MLIEHHYQVGAIVLAKLDAYPFWPAKVLTCLKNGSYKVMFLEQRSEAIVLPNMVQALDHYNLAKLKREKHTVHRDIHNSSIRIAQSILEERERGNREWQESVSIGSRGVQTRRSQSYPQEHNSYEATSSKNQSIQKDIYSEIKQLLDKLSKQAANLSNSNRVVRFTHQDQGRLYLLLNSESLDTKKLIDKFVVERLIITMKEVQEWGVRERLGIHQKLRSHLKRIKKEVVALEMGKQQVSEYRMKCLMERLGEVKIGVEE